MLYMRLLKILNKYKMKRIIFGFILGCFSLGVLAQPINDDCEGAIFLNVGDSYCSKAGEFNNADATASNLITPCFNPVQKDVWFSFVPNKTDVNITIKGAINVAGAGGTLRFPQVALFTGQCANNNLSELICAKSAGSNHIVSIYKGGLIIGERHFIRIQAGAAQIGTFQICIENYNPPKEPTGDCSDGSVLCDKSAFVVQSVTGFGNNNEVTPQEAPCFVGGTPGNIESNSTWFKWTCDKAGDLTFTLTPLKDEDDLDFVLFELPNGLDNCSNKKTLRCMASGETLGGCKLLGPTGLRVGSTDIEEDSGCKAGKDNFLAPLKMEVGKAYALMVNNFTSTKSGFKMDFGGEGTFLGPKADFVSNSLTKKLCYGEKIEFTDASKSTGTSNIVKWNWDFGLGASPRTKSDNVAGQKHTVTYNTPGKRYVVLTIESDRGCQITDIDTFVVDSCCKTFNKLNFNSQVNNLKCQDILEGSIDLNVVSNSQPVTYKWSFGSTSPNISGLGTGLYSVTVANAATCDTVLRFNVTAPPPIVTDTILKRPTCDGGTDGSITLNPSGGLSPYSFDWGNGYVPINSLTNLKVGKYPVFIKDQGGCQKLINVDLRELELNLDPTIEATREPKCFGSKDGSIDLKVINGKAPFEYDFGNGFQNSNTLSNIGAGQYSVVVKDANRCKGNFIFDIGQPELLVAKVDSSLISCFGANDGKIFAKAEGGTPGYVFSWNNNLNGDNLSGLSPGTYTLTLTDKNACTALAIVQLGQPPRLDVNLGNVKDVICNGERTGEINFEGKGGRPPYQYSLDGVIYQKSTTFGKLPAGNYEVVVKDTAGCEVSLPVKISQPSPFVLNAGPDKTIELGDDTQINTLVFPTGNILKSITWTPVGSLSCTDCLDPTVKPSNTITYTIKGIDVTDCIAIDQITIFVNKTRPIYIPNIFSPSDVNGTNDHFTVFGGKAAKQVELMRVYNRWGSLVYEGKNLPLNDPSKGWDGSFRGVKSNNNVFTYYIVVEFIDGEFLEYRGDITVM